MSFLDSNNREVATAVLLALVGIVMTTWAAFTHTAALVVPGATMIFVGSAWLGNALARRDVRLFPFLPAAARPPSDEGS
jgi:uncharacterized membrane protein HdeD (DUF308 family)